MVAKHFTELECWQLAIELKKGVFAFIARPPANRDFDFCDDIRRSSRSAPANISEGFGRATHGEFGNRLSVAIGELRETENHLLDALDCKYLDAQEHARLTSLAQRAAMTTIRLYMYLMKTPDYRMYR